MFGGVAVACLVAGCAWTVHSKILSASVYPTLGAASYDEPVAKSAPRIASRSVAQAVGETFALLSAPAPVIEKPATVAAITPMEFNDRFAASAPQGVESRAAEAAPAPETPKLAMAPRAVSAKLADAAKAASSPKNAAGPKKDDAPAQQVATNAPLPVPEKKSTGDSVRDMAQRAKAAVMSIASGERQSMVEKLWGKRDQSNALLAYASADASVTSAIKPAQNPMRGGSPPYDRDTAVYDITARTVYLPDGTKLEAHSGLGSKLDDPGSAKIRVHGVTPPHIYELRPREALFHGVPALRLNPIGGEEAIYGRAGLLAHTYMLGPNGDSNGCVSFKDYYAFLNAYRNHGIRKLAVVSRVE